MANTLRFKRGLVSGIPTAALGEPLFTTDTFDLYIGNGTTNTRFQKYIASGTTSQLLRGDGSLLTMPIVLTSPANGEVLKYDGTNWVNSSDAGVTGSGTNNYITKWTSASTIGNSLLQESTNAIGLGSTPNAWRSVLRAFDFGIASIVGRPAINQLFINTNNYIDSAAANIYIQNGAASRYYQGDGGHFWYSAASGTAGASFTFTETARLTATGNFIINNASTDNGIRFQVTGDGYFSGSVGIGTSSITAYNLRNNKNISGGTTAFGHSVDGIVQTDVSSFAIYNHTVAQTTAGGTYANLAHYNANQGGIGGTLTNQFGYRVAATLTGATNNYGFYGDIAAGTGRWNLYCNGTANNYMAASLGIGSTSLTNISLRISKTITGVTTGNGIWLDGQIQSDVTSSYRGFRSTLNIVNSTFTLANVYHVLLEEGTIGASSSVTNQYGLYVGNLTKATNNYGVYSEVASGTGRWNLYMNGSAANYANGNTLIGEPRLAGAAWTKYLVVGDASLDKVILGYLASSTNGATIGANNGNLNAWANLNIAGSQLIFRIAETERMRLDASGNLGLGVTPSAWSASFDAMQFGFGGAVFGNIADNATYISSNYFTNGAGQDIRINTGFVSILRQSVGAFDFFTAPSGAAGSVASFTQIMKLNSTGNLLIGTTTDAGFRLDVNGTMRVSSANNTTALTVSVGSNASYNFAANSTSGYSATFNINDTALYIGHNSSNRDLRLQTNSTDRLNVKGSGQVRFVPLAAAPTTNVEAGDVYYDSTTNKLRCYNGTTWNDLF